MENKLFTAKVAKTCRKGPKCAFAAAIDELLLKTLDIQGAEGYSAAFSARVSMTAMLASSSGGRPCRSFRYSGLL